MARPSTKQDLLLAAEQEFSTLIQLLEEMTMDDKMKNFDFSEDFLAKHKEKHWKRDKNVRDVLIHLYEWHQLLIHWIESNESAGMTTFLPKPYNWRTYSLMNQEFWQSHQSTELSEATDVLKLSHQKVMILAEGFTNEELFAKNQLTWTGTSTLGSYFVANTVSHYKWAISKIKKHRQRLK